MKEEEVIIVEIPDHIFDSVIQQCVKYAIISSPFTIDRMNLMEKNNILEGTSARVYNILKGKIAEKLFEVFCQMNDLAVDFESCSTPFYQIDKRDFIFGSQEFDLKNNFIYHSGYLYESYISLPALIPNRYPGDQWDSRLKPVKANQVSYIFSFLKGGENSSSIRSDFLTIYLSKEQCHFLHELYLKYQGKPTVSAPFDEDWFWEKVSKKGATENFNLNFRPKLIITGVAHKGNWEIMKDVGPSVAENYKDDPIKNWYQKVGMNKTLKFMNGIMWAKIKNRAAPMALLDPITTIFPTLRNKINYGRFKG